ncbi:MAG TPA: 2'-5' RNA ligase family protein [Gaiellaceae bacterium]|nr:2'-5' RNA ligase family protein [Gaiellaceae bacterium]
MPHTALLIVVPEAEPLVSDWRLQYDRSAQRGVPAHITLLYPFVPTEKVDEKLLGELHRLFGAHTAFSFDLHRVARFPEVAWLAPDPVAPFKALIASIVARFPDYPPYEGAHDDVIPHLTVAEGGIELQDRVEAAVSAHLPIRGHAGDVAFLFEDDEGLWHEAHRFPLSGRSAT